MEFPIDKFWLLYPQFYSMGDELVEAIAEQSLCYFSSSCSDDCHDQLWMLATAHMLHLRGIEANGDGLSGIATSASIDGVSVSLAAPSVGTSSSYWFNLSPFGQQFLALNKRCNNGIKLIGGSRERQAFRKAGGQW